MYIIGRIITKGYSLSAFKIFKVSITVKVCSYSFSYYNWNICSYPKNAKRISISKVIKFCKVKRNFTEVITKSCRTIINKPGRGQRKFAVQLFFLFSAHLIVESLFDFPFATRFFNLTSFESRLK